MMDRLEDTERQRIVKLAMAALVATPAGAVAADVVARKELTAILHKLAGVDVRVRIER